MYVYIYIYIYIYILCKRRRRGRRPAVGRPAAATRREPPRAAETTCALNNRMNMFLLLLLLLLWLLLVLLKQTNNQLHNYRYNESYGNCRILTGSVNISTRRLLPVGRALHLVANSNYDKRGDNASYDTNKAANDNKELT